MCSRAEVFRPAGPSEQLETPVFLPGINLRPADILLQPSAAPPGPPACTTVCVATLADAGKLRSLESAVCMNLSLTDTASIPDLGFNLVPLAVNTFGAPPERAVATAKQHAWQISMGSAGTPAIAKTRIWQKMSFAIWPSIATVILARLPVQPDMHFLSLVELNSYVRSSRPYDLM